MSPAFWTWPPSQGELGLEIGPYDQDEDVPCPDCDTPIPLGALACTACGLTLAEVADRVASGEAEWMT